MVNNNKVLFAPTHLIGEQFKKEHPQYREYITITTEQQLRGRYIVEHHILQLSNELYSYIYQFELDIETYIQYYHKKH